MISLLRVAWIEVGVFMKRQIVSDSSCDIHSLEGALFDSAPLSITTEEKEFIDDDRLSISELLETLRTTTKPTSTACPSIGAWLKTFNDADEVFVTTITSTLSGSWNSAIAAAREYMQQFPERKVHVFDSLSTGPEMILMLEKMRDLINQGLPFEKVIESIKHYQESLHLTFMLSSVRNLARNGRVKKIEAAAVGMLGIRIVGRASDKGDLELLSKTRGEKSGLKEMIKQIVALGCSGKKIVISHCCNEQGVRKLCELLRIEYPYCSIAVTNTRGLCSYYAEEGGIMVGFECA